eukprot:jgi/Galph1/4066/GphlegSOOS_G2762.1
MDTVTRERVKVLVATRVSDDPAATICMKTKCQGLVSKCVNTIAACKELSRGTKARIKCDQQVSSCRDSFLGDCAVICSRAYFGENKRAQCISECLNSKCRNPSKYNACLAEQLSYALASCIEENCGDRVRKCMRDRCNIPFESFSMDYGQQ